MASRLDREKSYHDKRFHSNPFRSKVLKTLREGVNEQAVELARRLIQAHCRDADVLDYGCGTGNASFMCANFGARSVVGIDISEVAVDQARKRSEECGFHNTTFFAMNALQLNLDDHAFDLVCGFGILHHLDINAAAAEVARVLKPSGAAVFLEPLGHNPAISLFRWLTPWLRSPDERPLLMKDIEALNTHFDRRELHFQNLCTLASVPFSWLPGCGWILSALSQVDRCVFAVFPFVRRYAWNVVLVLQEPRHSKSIK
jgi:SAM-dependent methyltransferase